MNWLSIGFSLASIHYGLGFLVGSGEAIYQFGAIGILYAISSALGLFSLTLISKFYLKKQKPIWDLLGDSYGTFVKKDVSFLSGIWMVGVVASQILGGAWALSIFGFNRYLSIAVISILIFLLSALNIGKLSNIFKYMLFFSSAVLLVILIKVGAGQIPLSITELYNSFSNITFYDIVGTILSTVLVTFIGMDFHQFIVKAKNAKNAVVGSLFGFTILLILSITLLALVQGGLTTNLIIGITDPKQVIPTMLYNFGKNIHPLLGFLFSLPIVFVSIGSGSGVTKVVTKNLISLSAETISEKFARIVIILVSILIALIGNSIINLIVSFYSIYVGSVIIPFILYLVIGNKKNNTYYKSLIRLSLIFGTLCSTITFIFYFVQLTPITEHLSTFILIFGIAGSLIGSLTFVFEHAVRNLLTKNKKL